MSDLFDSSQLASLIQLWRECDDATKKQFIDHVNGVPITTRKARIMARRILTHLNKLANKNYRESDVNLDPIVRLLKDGFTEQDIMAVIAIQCRRRVGTKLEIYLRPETLFNKTKFNSYVGEVPKG